MLRLRPTYALLLALALAVPALTAEWVEAPSLARPRSAHAVAADESVIVALAGTDDRGRPVSEVEAFDGSVWRTVARLPGDGLNAPTASIVEGRVYVIGGFATVTNRPTDEVHVLDLRTMHWSRGAPLPQPRGGHAAVVLAGRIHVLGGGNSRTTLADHSVYDPRTDTWRELAPVPRSVGSPAVVVVDGRIHLIGGRSGHADFGDVHIYGPATDTWSAGAAIEPRGTAGAVVHRGGILLCGGESQARRTNLDSVLRFDLATGRWTEATPLPTPRKFVRAVTFRGVVHLVGGSLVPAESHAPVGSASVLRLVELAAP